MSRPKPGVEASEIHSMANGSRSRLAQRAGVLGVEAKFINERLHRLFRGRIVAAVEQGHLAGAKGGVCHDVKPDGIERFDDARGDAHCATCSAAEVVVPRAKPERSGNSGLVASITILPERSPRLSITCWVTLQGVAISNTSPRLAAPGMVVRVPEPVFCSSPRASLELGSRTPKATVCPLRAQRAPRVPPTLPAPMMPIFMS
jgi:hypothetical protein